MIKKITSLLVLCLVLAGCTNGDLSFQSQDSGETATVEAIAEPVGEPTEDDDVFVLRSFESEPGELHPFPFPFPFKTLDIFGNEVTEADLGEKEIFFVHLWATWCPPCIQEMPELAFVADLYKDNVGFIGLLYDYHDNLEGAQRLSEHLELDKLNIYSGTEGLEELLQMVTSGVVPTTILIDGNGNIIDEKIEGARGLWYVTHIENALAYVRGE